MDSEKRKEYLRNYKRKNKDRINELRRRKRKILGKQERDRDAYTYFQKTGKTLKDYQHEYYLNNKNRIRQKIDSYEKKHKAYLDLKRKEYAEKYKSIFAPRRQQLLDAERFGGNRQLALERDNWQCQECGLNNEQHIVIFGVGLHVHHIDGNKKNNVLENFKTLCMKCHRKTFSNFKGVNFNE